MILSACVRQQDGIGPGWNAGGTKGHYPEKDQSYQKHDGKKKHESE